MGFAVTGLLVATTVGAAAPTPDPTILLRVDEAVVAQGESLTEPMVLSALGLRLAGSAVKVVAEATSPLWVVYVAPAGPRVGLRILTDGDETIYTTTLATQNRHPGDLAHTIALLVVETLTPLAPDAFAQKPEPPPEQPKPRTPRVDTTDEPAPIQWRVGVTGKSSFLFPKGRLVWGMGAVAEARMGLFFGAFDAAWWLPLRDQAEGLRLDVSQLVLRLLFGVQARWSHFVFKASLGPVFRSVFARAQGAEASFQRRTDSAWGLGTQAAVGLSLGEGLITLGVDAANYAKHSRFFAGDEVIVNAGHSTLGAFLGASWRF